MMKIMSTSSFRLFTFFTLALFSVLHVHAKFTLFNSPTFSIKNVPTFVTVDQAYPFSFSQQGDRVYLDWQVTPGYYLYQNRIEIIASDDAKIGALEMRQGQLYEDEFFGKMRLYKKKLTVTVPIISATNNSTLSVTYQGCAETGFCYPSKRVDVPLITRDADSLIATAIPSVTSASMSLVSKISDLVSQQVNVGNLADNWWQPLLFLGFGLGLSFTPCVLPMYPTLAGIVLGCGKKTHRQTFSLSMWYVQGMALTYTLLGLVVTFAGMQFQVAFQHPYVLVGISTTFILLAMSMFGLFTLHLPSFLQIKLSQLSNQQSIGSNLGIFTMGAISGLIYSPCTTAPLSGALLYIAQSSDLLTGTVTLYSLAIGMGIPLIITTMFGNKLLPKSGDWMDKVKTFFGFVLLMVPLLMFERLLSKESNILLWSGWLFAVLSWLYHVSRGLKPSKLASTCAILAIIGFNICTAYTYNKLFSKSEIDISTRGVDFIRIQSIDDLNRELASAKQAGKPVMLDFYADWCISCKKFEKYTFQNNWVVTKLKYFDFVLLQSDVTENRPQDIKLLMYLNVNGLPSLDFWDVAGNALPRARLTGFVDASSFLLHLNQNNLMEAE
nr:protein-disulfide reductase DsbD [Candidatus Enterovibrio escacola]